MATNEARTANTKSKLVAAARLLFASYGFAGTGTEKILADAGVKRGALYHHYRDKADLFEAVCHELAAEAAACVLAATESTSDPLAALELGSIAWIDFMTHPERRRILVLDAPGVLGPDRWETLDRELSFKLLQAGVDNAVESGAIRFSAGPVALAVLLNGVMNQIVIRATDADVSVLKSGLVELLNILSRQPSRT